MVDLVVAAVRVVVGSILLSKFCCARVVFAKGLKAVLLVKLGNQQRRRARSGVVAVGVVRRFSVLAGAGVGSTS
jgi:hypothetical protein